MPYLNKVEIYSGWRNSWNKKKTQSNLYRNEGWKCHADAPVGWDMLSRGWGGFAVWWCQIVHDLALPVVECPFAVHWCLTVNGFALMVVGFPCRRPVPAYEVLKDKIVLKLNRCDQELSKPGKPSQELGAIQEIYDGDYQSRWKQERSKEKVTKLQYRMVSKLVRYEIEDIRSQLGKAEPVKSHKNCETEVLDDFGLDKKQKNETSDKRAIKDQIKALEPKKLNEVCSETARNYPKKVIRSGNIYWKKFDTKEVGYKRSFGNREVWIWNQGIQKSS